MRGIALVPLGIVALEIANPGRSVTYAWIEWLGYSLIIAGVISYWQGFFLTIGLKGEMSVSSTLQEFFFLYPLVTAVVSGVLVGLWALLGGAFGWQKQMIAWRAESNSGRAAQTAVAPVRNAPGAAAKPASTPSSGRRGMILLSGGTYAMGETKKTVTVQSFLMDETEVTAKAYAACVKAGKCTPGEKGDHCTYGVKGKERHPVNCVDWTQAVAYCKWAGKRLPTEEEWEWAARGMTAGNINEQCWTTHDARRGSGKLGTCPVGSYPFGNSPQGVKDLAGNVWEWTDSLYGVDAVHRVFRGGGWGDGPEAGITAATRSMGSPDRRDAYLGFRCAKSQ